MESRPRQLISPDELLIAPQKQLFSLCGLLKASILSIISADVNDDRLKCFLV